MLPTNNIISLCFARNCPGFLENLWIVLRGTSWRWLKASIFHGVLWDDGATAEFELLMQLIFPCKKERIPVDAITVVGCAYKLLAEVDCHKTLRDV